jgi:CRISPR-associated protein Cas2
VWIFVLFDLPTQSKAERKKYAKFRKELQGDGFTMMQYSVYTRHCPSRENAHVHISRIKKMTPKDGHVSILEITDKQYSRIINMIGRTFEPMKKSPGQLELF